MGHILQCHDIIKTDFIHAEGIYLYDSRGERYTDLESGIWCTALGHNHPCINKAIETQLAQLTHIGTRYPNAQAEAAALAVLEAVGMGEGKCVFLSSGSEAVEFAAQAARRITGRDLLLTFSHSYLAAFGSAGRKSRDEWVLFDWTAETDEPLEARLDRIPFERVGGFVFEPGGSGSAFVRFAPHALVQAIVERVRQAGGLLVVNEITTGMGRTGKWFGFQHDGLEPDLVALSKGLGNGYPVSAVAMRPDSAGKLEASGLRYAQSHQNDPLGCAVACEVIRVMREEAWVERGAAAGAAFLHGLQALAGRHAAVKEARGRGMLLGLEMRLPYTAEAAYRGLLDRHFLTGYYPAGNILRFDPALITGEEDVRLCLAALDEMLTLER